MGTGKIASLASGVISIGPRETSRADVANPASRGSTRFEDSKREGIETFPKPNFTPASARQPDPADAGQGLVEREQQQGSSSLCRIGGPPHGACLLDLRPPSPGTSIPALRAQSQPWNRSCKSIHLPLWASARYSLAPLAASFLPSDVAERVD